jgi:hypothetical protein
VDPVDPDPAPEHWLLLMLASLSKIGKVTGLSLPGDLVSRIKRSPGKENKNCKKKIGIAIMLNFITKADNSFNILEIRYTF